MCIFYLIFVKSFFVALKFVEMCRLLIKKSKKLDLLYKKKRHSLEFVFFHLPMCVGKMKNKKKGTPKYSRFIYFSSLF